MLSFQGQFTSRLTSRSVQPVINWLQRRRSLAGSLLALTITIGTMSVVQAQQTESMLEPQVSNAIAEMSNQPVEQVAQQSNGSLQDGVYLYGQAPEPDQIGSGYVVFEARNQQVIGALYMPHSSFDCMYGSIAESELAMTVINSYGEGEYPHAIARNQSAEIANSEGGAAPGLQLAGMHHIADLSEMDQEVLAVCVDRFQNQVW